MATGYPSGSRRSQQLDLELRIKNLRQFVTQTKEASAAIRGIETTTKSSGKGIGRSFLRMAKSALFFRRVTFFAEIGTVAAFGNMAVAGLNFEQQLRRTSAVASDTGKVNEKTYQQLGRTVISVSKKTIFSNEEVTAGLLELTKAGFTAQEAQDALLGTMRLAEATQYDAADATTVQAQTLNAFGMQAKDASKVADVLTQVVLKTAADMPDLGIALQYTTGAAKAAGIPFDDLAVAIGLLSDRGIRGSKAGTTLRGALTRMIAPTKQAKEAMKGLGISSDDLVDKRTGKLIKLHDIIVKLRTGLKKIPKAKQLGEIKKIVGLPATPGILNLINAPDKGRKSWEELTKQVAKSKGVAQNVGNSINDSLLGTLKRIRNNIQGLFNEFLLRYGGGIKKFLKDLLGDLENVKLDDVIAALQPIIDDIKAIGLVAKNAWNMMKPLVLFGFWSMWQVVKLLNPVLKFLANNLDLVAAAFAGVFVFFAAQKVLQIIKMTQAIIKLYKTFRELAAVVGIARAVSIAFSGTLLATPVGWVILGLAALAVALTLIITHWDQVKAAIVAVFDWIKSHWKLLVGIMLGPLALVIMAIIAKWDLIKTTFTTAISVMKAKFWDFVHWIESLPAKFLTWGRQMGKNLFDGILDGIKNLPSAVAGKLGDVGGGILGGIGGVAGHLNPLGWGQTGGRVMGSGNMLVGEAGPEILNVPSGARVIPLRQQDVAAAGIDLGGFGAGTITTQVFLDRRQIATAVHQVAKESVARR